MSERLASLSLVPHRALLILLLLAGASTPWPAAATSKSCGAAELVPLNSTFRDQREEPKGTDLLRLIFPSAGVAMLHSSSPANEKTQPHLSFLGDSCTGGGGYAVIRQTPAGLLLRILAPGPHFLTVSPENPDKPLGYYKLQTAFATAPAWPDEVISLDVDPPESCAAEGFPSFSSEPLAENCFIELHRQGWQTKDVDPIDCDVVGGGFAEPGILVIEAPDPLQATLYAGTDCGPEDRRAEGTLGDGGAFVAAPIHAGDYRLDLQLFQASSYAVGLKYYAICGLGERDDHLDVPLCATPLEVGSNVAGMMGDAYRDDEDYFTFTVAAQDRVKIDVRSEESVLLALYDEDGQHLASRKCSKGCAKRIVRTLGEGRYYLGVSSSATAMGGYVVSVARVGSQ